jgi:hypothetical protein
MNSILLGTALFKFVNSILLDAASAMQDGLGYDYVSGIMK